MIVRNPMTTGWFVVNPTNVVHFQSRDIVRRQLAMTPSATVWAARDVTKVEDNRYIHVYRDARPIPHSDI